MDDVSSDVTATVTTADVDVDDDDNNDDNDDDVVEGFDWVVVRRVVVLERSI